MISGLDINRVKRLFCLGAGLAVLACAVCSLRWRAVHDVPILMYAARLMTESHAVPYRDFFDMNLPGTYWMMGALVRFFGCSDLAVRLFDLTVLGFVLALTFVGLRRWGWDAAMLGVCLVALRYFAGTWRFSLQREYLALLPLSAMLAWMVHPSPCSWKGGGLLGVLFAWMALIKPQFVIFVGPVMLFALGERLAWKHTVLFGFSLAVGFCLPMAGCVIWLVWHGAWSAFLEQAVEYWPLYGQMSGTQEVLTGGDRWRYVLRGAGELLGSGYPLVACIGIAFWAGLGRSSPQWLLYYGSMIVCSLLLPCFAGKFWEYHRIPFFYATLYVAALAFAEPGRVERPPLLAWGSVGWGTFLMVLCVGISLPRTCREAFGEGAVKTEKRNVPDAVADYLKAHLVTGDRVQPLDWTGGAVHGMLMANALPATRFLYDFHFYHHVNTPVIRRIRKEFLSALEATPPRFLIDTMGQVRPHGPGTSETFAELERWRADHYHVVESKSGYRIWERSESQNERK
jgi:hypothetical protein